MNGMNFSLASNRLDPQPETFDLDDANLLTDAQRRRRVRVPQLACVTNLTLFIEVFDDFGALADHHPRARDDRAALRAAAQKGDGEHDEGAVESEEEVVEAVSTRALPMISPGSSPREL